MVPSDFSDASPGRVIRGSGDYWAQLTIGKLAAAGILEEATGRKRDRVFVARGILHVLDAEQAGPSS